MMLDMPFPKAVHWVDNWQFGDANQKGPHAAWPSRGGNLWLHPCKFWILQLLQANTSFNINGQASPTARTHTHTQKKWYRHNWVWSLVWNAWGKGTANCIRFCSWAWARLANIYRAVHNNETITLEQIHQWRTVCLLLGKRNAAHCLCIRDLCPLWTL